MMRRSDIARAGLILALVAGGVVARNFLDKPENFREKAAKAEADLCRELDTMDSAFDPVDQVTADTKVRELLDANMQADKEVQGLKRSLANLEAVRIQDLETAISLFRKSMELLPGGENVGGAAPLLAEKFEAVRAARQRVHAPLDCGKYGTLGR